MGIMAIFAARQLERVARNTDIRKAAILRNSFNTKYDHTKVVISTFKLSQVTQALRKTCLRMTETRLIGRMTFILSSQFDSSEVMMKVANGLT